jgi:hypothetical protein
LTYHRVDVLLGVISIAIGVLVFGLNQRRLANAVDLLVGLGTVMVTFLTGTSDGELNARRMPSSNTSDLKMCI